MLVVVPGPVVPVVADHLAVDGQVLGEFAGHQDLIGSPGELGDGLGDLNRGPVRLVFATADGRPEDLEGDGEVLEGFSLDCLGQVLLVALTILIGDCAIERSGQFHFRVAFGCESLGLGGS